MRNFALLALCAIMLNGCEASAGNPGVGYSGPYADTQSAADAESGSDSTVYQGDSLLKNDTVGEPTCVDLSVNEYIYDCQDGNPETPIIANPETCKYSADMWASKAGNTQVLDGAKRVIAKYGTNIADCLVKRKK